MLQSLKTFRRAMTSKYHKAIPVFLFALFIFVSLNVMIDFAVTLKKRSDVFTQRQELLLDTWDHDYYVRPRGDKRLKRLPDVIIIGVSKCGTRALRDFLELHPNIVAAVKEAHFFDDDELYEQGAGSYIDMMPLSHSDQLTMEKTPDYFECERCMRRMSKMVRGSKLLIVLCDPVKRVVSQYMQSREKNLQSGLPMPEFEDWALDPATGNVREDLPAVQSGIYHDILDDWFKFFPDYRIHVLDGNALKKDPLHEMKKVEKFLELKPFLTSRDIYFNSTRGFYCIYQRRNGKYQCPKSDKGRKHIVLSPDINQTLTNFFSVHNSELKRKYGYNMSWAENWS